MYFSTLIPNHPHAWHGVKMQPWALRSYNRKTAFRWSLGCDQFSSKREKKKKGFISRSALCRVICYWRWLAAAAAAASFKIFDEYHPSNPAYYNMLILLTLSLLIFTFATLTLQVRRTKRSRACMQGPGRAQNKYFARIPNMLDFFASFHAFACICESSERKD